MAPNLMGPPAHQQQISRPTMLTCAGRSCPNLELCLSRLLSRPRSCLNGPNSCSAASVESFCKDSLAPDAMVNGLSLIGICPPTHGFLCPADTPPGAVGTGGGLCYVDQPSCLNGPNACTGAEPCVASATCPDTFPFICRVNTSPKLRAYRVNTTVLIQNANFSGGAVSTLVGVPGTQPYQSVANLVSLALGVPPQTVGVSVVGPTMIGVNVSVATAAGAEAVSAGLSAWLPASPVALAGAATGQSGPSATVGQQWAAVLAVDAGLARVSMPAAPLITPPPVPEPPKTWLCAPAAPFARI